MTAYYNEIDPYAADWLRGLIRHGFIAPGDVDERDIANVRPDDLRGYAQHHFFAGIGGWSLALRLAGWSDDRPVWTGSCPCQALSSAARGRNVAPDLWPAWQSLIAATRPRVLFGEQVARPRIYFVGHANGDGESIGALNAEMAKLQRDRSKPGNMVPPNGVSNRMAIMRAFGNAIHPTVAAEFILASAYGPSPGGKT